MFLIPAQHRFEPKRISTATVFGTYKLESEPNINYWPINLMIIEAQFLKIIIAI
jgi:hypothetical protein